VVSLAGWLATVEAVWLFLRGFTDGHGMEFFGGPPQPWTEK